jgi:hypothetical protein
MNNSTLNTIYNKVTSAIFNKGKAKPDSPRVIGSDVADIFYGILNHLDQIPAEKFKGNWVAGPKLAGQYWLASDKLWLRNTNGTDTTAPTVATADWSIVLSLNVPPIRYTIPFGPQTTVQVPFVKNTTITLFRKFGEVATLQYRIGSGTLTTVTFTNNSNTPNLLIPAGSTLELVVGWGALPTGKGSVYLEAIEA